MPFVMPNQIAIAYFQNSLYLPYIGSVIAFRNSIALWEQKVKDNSDLPV